MVIITDKMKQTMNDHPVQFFLELRLVEFRIFPYGIDTDEKISGKHVSLTIIKSNYVSEVIMLKESLIDVKYIIVGAEDDVDLSEFLDFTFGNKLEPGIVEPAVLELELGLFEEVRYHKSYNEYAKLR